MSPKCKVSFFFFLFKLFTKSSWKSERQLPLQGLKSIKTTTEQLKQSEREKEKKQCPTFGIWFYPQVFPELLLELKAKYLGKHGFWIHRKGSLSASANRGSSVQSDCGVHGSLAQAGVPGLVPSNHPFQEIKQPTIHGAIWPPSPPRKSGPKHSTRQPAGSQSRSSAGIRSFINPSMDDANSASTFPTPTPDPRLALSTLPWQSYFPALSPTSSSGLGGIYPQLLPLQPLTSTDPSCDLSPPLASPSAIHILTQVPKTLRLDGATREEGKFPSGNQGTSLPGTQGQ